MNIRLKALGYCTPTKWNDSLYTDKRISGDTIEIVIPFDLKKPVKGEVQLMENTSIKGDKDVEYYAELLKHMERDIALIEQWRRDDSDIS